MFDLHLFKHFSLFNFLFKPCIHKFVDIVVLLVSLHGGGSLLTETSDDREDRELEMLFYVFRRDHSAGPVLVKVHYLALKSHDSIENSQGSPCATSTSQAVNQNLLRIRVIAFV